MKKTTRPILAALVAVFVFALNAAAADATGNWKWSFTPPNGGEAIESTAKLEAKDGVLTGTVTSRFGESPISDGSVKDGLVTFNLVRERDGQKFVIKYSGQLEGDTIKGAFEFSGFGGGGAQKIDWTATRAK